MPLDHAELSDRLLAYLRDRSSDRMMAYSEPLQMLAGGFDAAIFSFRLATTDPSLSGALVLRLIDDGRSADMTRKEAVVQDVLASMGYPAPDVRIEENDKGVLGGAFLIMPRLPGQALAAEFERLSREQHDIAWIVATARRIMRDISAAWDDAQTRLQELDPDEFLKRVAAAGLDPQSFCVDAALSRFRAKIPPDQVPGFAAGFDWLQRNQPQQTERVVCHGDLQPLNVLADNGRLSGVLDWGATIVGDPAVDYGAVIAIMATAPIGGPPIARPFIRMLMSTLARIHARPYLARYPGGRPALRYFAAYNCMSQLASVAAPRSVSAGRGGAYRSAVGLRNLVAGFRRFTGVRLRFQLIPKQRGEG